MSTSSSSTAKAEIGDHPSWQQPFREAKAEALRQFHQRQRELQAQREQNRLAQCQQRNEELSKVFALLKLDVPPQSIDCGVYDLHGYALRLDSYGEWKTRDSEAGVRSRLYLEKPVRQDEDGEWVYARSNQIRVEQLISNSFNQVLADIADAIDEVDRRVLEETARYEREQEIEQELARKREEIANSIPADEQQGEVSTDHADYKRSAYIRYFRFDLYDIDEPWGENAREREREIGELLAAGWQQIDMKPQDGSITVCLINPAAIGAHIEGDTDDSP